MIHPTAIIHSGAELDEGVEVGPYCIIGDKVKIQKGTILKSHVVVEGPTRIGKDNEIHPFASIGADPQDKKFDDDTESVLEIGDGNTIREYCSINRGTESGGGITRLGDHNWIMAYVHIAHDCIVGSNTIFANNSTLAGHVTIDDFVILGGFSGVHQFCHIGAHAFTAISSVVVKDVPPFLMVSGNTAKPCGLNKEGLKRRGFTSEDINAILSAYKTLYRQSLTLNDAMEALAPMAGDNQHVESFLTFLKSSHRGIIR